MQKFSLNDDERTGVELTGPTVKLEANKLTFSTPIRFCTNRKNICNSCKSSKNNRRLFLPAQMRATIYNADTKELKLERINYNLTKEEIAARKISSGKDN